MQSPGPSARALLSASPPATTRRWLTLALGIVAISTGSILTRLAQAPALVVGAWRMLLAAALLAPWGWPRLRHEAGTLTRREWFLLALSGVVLALHFATWITSLAYTTVASSVILVTTNPIYVGLASHFILGERVSRRKIIAIGAALLGSIIISYGDFALAGKALWGDLLALLGALAASAYILLGRALRRKLSIWAYAWPCYGLAGIVLLVWCLATGQALWGYGPSTWLILLALAVGPQIMGHSAFNWALAHFSPVFVTLAILGEPVGATVLAWLVLGEVPPITALLGGALILGSMYGASQEELALQTGHTS